MILKINEKEALDIFWKFEVTKMNKIIMICDDEFTLLQAYTTSDPMRLLKGR